MFWNNFEALCAKKGVSYNAAAADVGVRSSGTVTGWKNGAKPRGPVLKRLADYFGVTVEELTGEAPEQKEKPAPGEGSELDEKAQAILNKMKKLSPEQQTAFWDMLNTTIDAVLNMPDGNRNENKK